MSQSTKVLKEFGKLAIEDLSGAKMVQPMEALSAGRTLTAADNGTTFEVTAAGGVAIVLPSVSALPANWSVKVVQGILDASVTGDSTITATAAIMSGGIVCMDGAVGSSAETGTVVTFDESSASARGDYVTLTVNADSTLIYVEGKAAATVGITLV